MKQTAAKILAGLAKQIMAKYKPKVVGVSGSIGKSSTKEAAFAVLSEKYKTRTNIKSYNNEFGLPLTIIGAESPGRNVFKWISVLWKGFSLAHSHHDYPEVLVLELGIDHAGEIDKLIEIARSHVAVLTTVGVSHLELFGSEHVVLQEESKNARSLGRDGYAVLNVDDAKVKSLIPKMQASVISYGFDASADLQITNYHTTYHDKIYGTNFTLKYKGESVEIFLPRQIGTPHVYACAGGAAVGLAMKMRLSEIAAALKTYKPQPGRMQVFHGIKESTIIDDTYNAAPLSVEVALKELAQFPAERKIVALGDMNELGKISEEAHRNLAQPIIASGADYFIGVGSQIKFTIDSLRQYGFKTDHIFYFETSPEAVERIQELLLPGTVILLKGSQNRIRMEKIVKEILANPADAKLLCRSDKSWQGK